MSSRLQLDVSNLSLGRRRLVKVYEVKAGISVIAGETVRSMRECLECEVLQKEHYTNTLTFTIYQCCESPAAQSPFITVITIVTAVRAI